MTELIVFMWLVGVLFTWGVLIGIVTGPFNKMTYAELVGFMLISIAVWPILLGIRAGSD